MRIEACYFAPKTNAHVCTSLLLNMSFQVIEKFLCGLRESAIAAHRKDDVFWLPVLLLMPLHEGAVASFLPHHSMPEGIDSSKFAVYPDTTLLPAK